MLAFSAGEANHSPPTAHGAQKADAATHFYSANRTRA
jgi:hypothetical protein